MFSFFICFSFFSSTAYLHSPIYSFDAYLLSGYVSGTVAQWFSTWADAQERAFKSPSAVAPTSRRFWHNWSWVWLGHGIFRSLPGDSKTQPGLRTMAPKAKWHLQRSWASAPCVNPSSSSPWHLITMSTLSALLYLCLLLFGIFESSDRLFWSFLFRIM